MLVVFALRSFKKYREGAGSQCKGWGCQQHRGHAPPGPWPPAFQPLPPCSTSAWVWWTLQPWCGTSSWGRGGCSPSLGLLLVYFHTSMFKQEERAVRGRNLLVQDHDWPLWWKVQFNLGNSSRPNNQCQKSIQGKHFITDELGHIYERKNLLVNDCCNVKVPSTKQWWLLVERLLQHLQALSLLLPTAQ